MQKPDCVFCKIAAGEIPSAKIWENENFLAILDIQPNTPGMTVVMSKDHYGSYAFDMPDAAYQEFMDASRSAAKILEQGLPVSRVAMVMEGTGVNHVHIKLYPMHGIGEKFEDLESKEPVFYEKYPGFIHTRIGPKADLDELNALAQHIRSNTS